MNYLGIDYGERRVGLAIGNDVARLARPLTTIEGGSGLPDRLQEVVKKEAINELVLGLPRGLEGQDTAQTQVVRQLARELESVGLLIHLQDEAATSELANERLGPNPDKSAVDQAAATILLQDFLDQL